MGHTGRMSEASEELNEDEASMLLAFGIAASVKHEIGRGEGGLDIRRGTMHFAAGAKVWVVPPRWGDGEEQVGVVGRHLGSRGPYILLVMPRQHLENFRTQGVYSSALFAAMTKPMKRGGSPGMSFGLWEGKEAAAQVAPMWNQPTMEAHFDEPRGWGYVPDPPPMELERDLVVFYLAHFNANRAWYSSQLPPREAGDTT